MIKLMNNWGILSNSTSQMQIWIWGIKSLKKVISSWFIFEKKNFLYLNDRVAKKLEPNAYLLELPNDLAISSVVNVCDLSPIYRDEDNIIIKLNEFTPKSISSIEEIIDILNVQNIIIRHDTYVRYIISMENPVLKMYGF